MALLLLPLQLPLLRLPPPPATYFYVLLSDATYDLLATYYPLRHYIPHTTYYLSLDLKVPVAATSF